MNQVGLSFLDFLSKYGCFLSTPDRRARQNSHLPVSREGGLTRPMPYLVEIEVIWISRCTIQRDRQEDRSLRSG